MKTKIAASCLDRARIDAGNPFVVTHPVGSYRTSDAYPSEEGVLGMAKWLVANGYSKRELKVFKLVP